MDRLLASFERRFGRFAIPNLTYVIAAGMAAVFVISMVRPQFEALLDLDFELVKRGQVWRLFTYAFLPPEGGGFLMPRPIAVMFGIYFFWLVGNSLEQEWGAFKLNAFYFVGMLGTTVAAILAGGAGNFYLNVTLFFAFATIFPDYQILLFFIVPVKVKWFAILSALFMIFSFVRGEWQERAAILAATSNYLLFFSGHWLAQWRGRNVRVRQAARRAGMSDAPKATGGRTCAICGAREDAGADIRVCSCAKCGGPRTLCLEHARNH